VQTKGVGSVTNIAASEFSSAVTTEQPVPGGASIILTAFGDFL